MALFLKHIHDGKPRGYLWHLAYTTGLIRLLPDGIRPKGLIPASSFFGPRATFYSSVPGEADDEGKSAKHYWSKKYSK